jgi:uncharacterized membrane protein YeiB
MESSKNRIIGFDLARAYAIFGMFIVNFNTVFGRHTNHEGLSGFLSLFNGNSSTLFVMLAGMGVALMSNRVEYTELEKKNIKSVILKRSWFLFFIGLVLCLWWPADILHFYGGYMHIAAFLLFVPKRWYLIAASGAIVIWHLLLLVIPFETGWDFSTLQYTDFWTVSGFLRNTLYNGWNPIFPWIAYFLLGMWLGRLNWSDKAVKIKVVVVAEIIFIATEALQYVASQSWFNTDLACYITADYIPPALPFMLSTASFGCAMLVVMMWVGEKWGETKLAQHLASTGQMTLTHYIVSLTVGMVLLAFLTGKEYTGKMTDQEPSSPLFILLYSIVYFVSSIGFSVWWKSKFKNGPFELLMRKISGLSKGIRFRLPLR